MFAVTLCKLQLKEPMKDIALKCGSKHTRVTVHIKKPGVTTANASVSHQQEGLALKRRGKAAVPQGAYAVLKSILKKPSIFAAPQQEQAAVVPLERRVAAKRLVAELFQRFTRGKAAVSKGRKTLRIVWNRHALTHLCRSDNERAWLRD